MREIMHRLHDELDDRHWWFAARRRIVLRLLDDALRRARFPDRPRILDIGCGAGAILRELARRGEAFGLDAEPSEVAAAIRRSGCDVRLGRLPDDVPFEAGSFDVVTLLDVLEHIDDDRGVLATITRLLRPGGFLLCTVPAYRFLWSGHDVINMHKRRYTRPWLRRRLEEAGLQVRKLSYYNTLLFPPIAALRVPRGEWRHAPEEDGGAAAAVARLAVPAGADPGTGATSAHAATVAESGPAESTAGAGSPVVEERPDLGAVPEPLNAILRGIFAAERHWLRLGNFPFGVSVLALAQKPGGAA